MLYQSLIERRGIVPFPEYTGERVYMEAFIPSDGLPSHLSRWQPTVDAMLDGIEAPGPVYIMIDQTPVTAGKTQRRPGVHIDGYWNPGIKGHWPHGHQPRSSISMHGPSPSGPSHRASPPPSHRPVPSEPRHSSGSVNWGSADFSQPEAVILASTIGAARALVGEYEGPIGEMGDCSHLDVEHLSTIHMEAHHAYVGNVTCLHESLPVLSSCVRSLVRLNVPGV